MKENFIWDWKCNVELPETRTFILSWFFFRERFLVGKQSKREEQNDNNQFRTLTFGNKIISQVVVFEITCLTPVGHLTRHSGHFTVFLFQASKKRWRHFVLGRTFTSVSLVTAGIKIYTIWRHFQLQFQLIVCRDKEKYIMYLSQLLANIPARRRSW